MKNLKTINEMFDPKQELKTLCSELELTYETEPDGDKYWGMCYNKDKFCIFDTKSYDSIDEVEISILDILKKRFIK